MLGFAIRGRETYWEGVVVTVGAEASKLAQRYRSVRDRSLRLCEPLAIEDYGVQPMPDASPPKWHLAHTTWFFETFLLKPHLPFGAPKKYMALYQGVALPPIPHPQKPDVGPPR